MSYGHRTAMQEILNEFVGMRQSFDAREVTDAIQIIHEESGQYYDPIEIKKIKAELLAMFEKGAMPGYCMKSEPYANETGVYWSLRFEPSNPMDPLDLILPPELEEGDDEYIASCHIHVEFVDIIRKLSVKADCSEDTLIRSVLIRGLQLIYDEMD